MFSKGFWRSRGNNHRSPLLGLVAYTTACILRQAVYVCAVFPKYNNTKQNYIGRFRALVKYGDHNRNTGMQLVKIDSNDHTYI